MDRVTEPDTASPMTCLRATRFWSVLQRLRCKSAPSSDPRDDLRIIPRAIISLVVTTQVVARSPDRRPESVMVSEFGVRVTARPKESFDMTSADRFEGVGGPGHA